MRWGYTYFKIINSTINNFTSINLKTKIKCLIYNRCSINIYWINEWKGMRYNLYVCIFLKEIYISPELTLGETENLNQVPLKKNKVGYQKYFLLHLPHPKYEVQIIFLQVRFTKPSKNRQKNQEQKWINLPNSLYKASIISLPKQGKDNINQSHRNTDAKIKSRIYKNYTIKLWYKSRIFYQKIYQHSSSN